MVPSRSQNPVIGGDPYSCGVWVKIANQVWPGTGAWFRTPLWFLLKNVNPTPDDLVACALGLPPRFRADLLEPFVPNGSAALRLIQVPKDFLFGFTDPANPWSLGALACAMRRAELAADAGTMRRAGVGIMWLINYFLQHTDPVMHAPLEQLRQLVKSHLDELVYPSQFQLSAPITEADIDRFGRERESYLRYFDECDFSNWEIDAPPPWVERAGEALSRPDMPIPSVSTSL